jgi:hypothetical protein
MDAYAEVDETITMGLDALEIAICEELLRPAAHQGALVMYDEARRLVPVDSGKLKSAIYRAHVPEASGATRQAYVVSWNKRKAPHGFNVEFGHWRYNKIIRQANGRTIFTKERLDQAVWVPAKPFFRPAWDAVSKKIVERMQERMRELFPDAVAKVRQVGGSGGTDVA